MTNIGKALHVLRGSLALRDTPRDQPLAVRYGMALGSIGTAIAYLECVDSTDVARWIDNECCAECGNSEVATLTDDGVPYCARHANALRDAQDTDLEDSRDA